MNLKKDSDPEWINNFTIRDKNRHFALMGISVSDSAPIPALYDAVVIFLVIHRIVCDFVITST